MATLHHPAQLHNGVKSMARKKGLMTYQHDIFDRLEDTTVSEQLYNAHAVIGRLRDNAYQYFEEGSTQFEKWDKECIDLDNHLRKFSRPLKKGEEVPIVLLEKFIVQFEHAERRLRQVLNENPIPECYQNSATFETDSWLNTLLRFAVYATLLDLR